MKVTRVPITQLIPDPVNARKHNERNIDAIKGSLSLFGQQRPLVVDKKNVVVAGNGTLAAAKQLGWTEIDVFITDLTGSQARAFALADNKTAELAEWDDEILKQTLDALLNEGFEVEDIGFDIDDIPGLGGKSGLTDDDEVPDVPQNIHGVTLGDIWQLGKHRLMCGDSTSKEAVEKLMDGQKADMVFTDPPYGMNLDVEYDKMFSKGGDHKNTGDRFKKVEGDDKDYDPSHIFQIFDCDKFLWGCDYYYDKLPAGGCFLAWDKRDENLDKVPGNPTEFCWSDKPRRRMSFRIKWSGHHGMQKDDTKKRVHPTQKPAALVEAFFEQWGKGKTLIADIFLGSGSTLIACEKTNRKCYGMELDPHYCSVIIERWQNFTGQKAKKADG